MFILACMAKRLNDEEEEEKTHEKLTEGISGSYEYIHDGKER